ncbi:MAG: hypothetical protein KGZ33_04725 [Alkaliphilus sp.]|nr:hypothetical protein [Alkaliphilus sp.]
MHKRKLNICLIGFGNAGKEFCSLLINKREHILELTGFDLEIRVIATKTKGSLINMQGIDLQKALDEIDLLGRFDKKNLSFTQCSSLDLIQQSKADILIELSTLSIADGQPAIKHIETAFQNGSHVITANKGPLAWAYSKLKDMSQNNNLQFLHETTVMDGAPVFNLVKETLLGCTILSFKGILNSTTNFVLEQMEKGYSLDQSIKEAQSKGFAEADPSLDIDGWDAATKTAVLANVLMGANLTPMDIDRTGISHITLDDVFSAKEKNKKIKLVCEGFMDGTTVIGKVHPVLIDGTDIFSNIDGTSSILTLRSDLMASISMVEQNPKIQQTAYGIYSDLLTLLKHLRT